MPGAKGLNAALMIISATTLMCCMMNVPTKTPVEESTSGGTPLQQNRYRQKGLAVGIAIAFFGVAMIAATVAVYASVRCLCEPASPATSRVF